MASVDWTQGGIIVPLYHPRHNIWSDHFRIDRDTGYIDPITAIGRITIRLLQMNNTDRITDRQLLIAANQYPCEK